MSWTKRQVIEAAFEEIGLAPYVYDLTDDQLQSALRRLDAMLATWNAKGIRIGYPLPSVPTSSNLDDETNTPDFANQAMIMNLAIQIAPAYGKTVSPDTKMGAKDAYRTMLMQTTTPIEKQLPGGMPRGAGNKPWQHVGDEFTNEPINLLLAGSDSILTFE